MRRAGPYGAARSRSPAACRACTPHPARRRPHPGRRVLAMARDLGYPLGQALALTSLGIAASYVGDLDDAIQLEQQAGQILDIPRPTARVCGYLLTEAGGLPAAEQACTDTLAQARDAGDLSNLGQTLPVMADVDLQAGRATGAAAHLREAAQIALQTGIWFTMLNVLEGCGFLCAATGRPADAVTAWAAGDRLGQQGGLVDTDTDPYVRRREEALRQARQALGPDRASAARR